MQLLLGMLLCSFSWECCYAASTGNVVRQLLLGMLLCSFSWECCYVASPANVMQPPRIAFF